VTTLDLSTSLPTNNPIWIARARARLRPRHVLSWGAVTLTITTFVFIMIYRNVKEHEIGTMATAAKSTLPAIVIIQGILLMFIGTGAVASAVSQDRDQGLLDYQRMTPMSPTAKIIGYLFGLPVREYFLFALTLPFVVLAAIMSGFSFLTLLHFYAVFFTSVWVYHMTALMAGMVAPKPRLATSFSMGMVVVLYFVLPMLSRLGISYFEFLTIRPTFFGLIDRELPDAARDVGPLSSITPFRDVPFFTASLHPTVYTLMVQSFLIAVMYVVVHRKWRNQNAHVLSKSQGIAVYMGVVFFLLASIWPIITRPDVFDRVFRSYDWARQMPEAFALMLLVFVSLAICGVVGLVVIATTCPSRFRVVESLRRARRLGRQRPSFDSDGASALPVAIAIIVISCAAGALVFSLAARSGRFFDRPPTVAEWAPPALLIALVVLFVQGFRERFSLRVFAVSVFLLWMVPFFAMAIIWSADEEEVLGAYIGIPCPAVAVWLVVVHMFEQVPLADGTHMEFAPPDIRQSLGTMTLTSLAFYGVLAAYSQVSLFIAKRALRTRVHDPSAAVPDAPESSS